jgi:excisionase family DNA binding protein
MTTSVGGGGKEIFSTHDAAAICRVTPMTVIRWIKDGKISAFKTAGGHRRILRADLERFCQARGIPMYLDAEPARGRILVVEGDAGVRDLITDAARAVDDRLTIEVAVDAFGAGRMISGFRPNLLFLAQRLPGLDTSDACARLSRDPDMAPLSIVVVAPSASPTADSVRAFRTRGAAGYLPRPPSVTQIQRHVRDAFGIPERAPRPRPTIHIVDRDTRAGRNLRRELEQHLPDARITHFVSPVDALFAVTLDQPDLIILDVGNLDLEPGHVIQRILARLPDSEPRILASCPDERHELRSAAMGAGARSFLVKPVSVADVVACLKVGRRREKRKKKRQ